MNAILQLRKRQKDPGMVSDYRPQHPRCQSAVVHAQEKPKSYQAFRRSTMEATFGSDGAGSSQGNNEPATYRRTRNKDISMQVPADTAFAASVVGESLPNSRIQSGNL